MRRTYIILLLQCACNVIMAQLVTVRNAEGLREFNDMPAALTYANTSATVCVVTLQDEVNVIDTPLTLSNTMTLDLNGCTLTGFAPTMLTITKGAAVTLQDTKGGGVIFQNSDPESSTVRITDGSLHITSGEIRNHPYRNTEFTKDLWGVVVDKRGSLTMDGGKINVECTQGAYGVYVTGGTAVVNDGEVNVKCLRDGAAVRIPSAKNVVIAGGNIFYNSVFGEYHDIVTNVSSDCLSVTGGKFLHEGNLQKYSGEKHVTWVNGYYTISNEPMTTYAAMIKHKGTAFSTVEEALSSAVTGDTVVVMNDSRITANATVKRGTVLLVPYDMAGTCYTKHPQSTFHHIDEYLYRTLTIDNGVTLTVEGELSVSARQSSAEGGQFCGAGSCHGPHGAICMAEGALIDVKDGAGLYCWGYIYGNGRVEMNSGSALYEALQITDWRGGSISSVISETTFPFNQYYVQNVEVPVRFCYGSRNIVASDLFFGYSEGAADKEMHRIDDISYISNDGTGLFRMMPNTVIERTYNGDTDRMEYVIDGDMELGCITVETYNSDSYILPIPNNMGITQQRGGIMVNNRYILSAGARITIAPEAAMHIGNKGALYVIDKQDWDCFAALGYVLPLEYTMANGHGNRAVRWSSVTKGNDSASYDKMTNAIFDIQGTLLCHGTVMTSSHGASVVCTAERQAETETGTKYYGGRITRDRLKTPDTLLMCIRRTDSLKQVSVVPVMLRNADSTTLPTDSYAVTPVSFVYDGGMWHVCGDANGDHIVTMADANMVKNNILGINTPKISPAAADIDGNGRLDQEDVDQILQMYLK